METINEGNQEIVDLLMRVRKWAEDTNKETRWWGHNLSGACAVCSYLIFRRLKKLGYKPVLVYCHNIYSGHVHVRVNDIILDVTATQFNVKQEIIITRVPNPDDSNWYWTRVNATFRTKEAFKRSLLDWPTNQQPLSDEMKERTKSFKIH